MILFLDTTSSQIILALFKNQQLIDKLIKKASFRQAEILLKEMDKFLKRNKVNLRQIKGIIIVKGPGSFTGIRIGIAVANTISFALNIPLWGIKKKSELDLKKIADLSAYQEKFKNQLVLPFYGNPPNITRGKKKI